MPAVMGTRYRPPYLQRAVVIIDGMLYYEWESVYVRLEHMGKPANTFRFTCSEQEPFAESWVALRIRPGDRCVIWLDGEQAINGVVDTRQVFYDSHTHIVEIQGYGLTGILNYGGMVSKTGEWKNLKIDDITRVALKQFGLNLETIGQLSQFKFPRVSVTPGETGYEFIERHARAVNATMGENNNGDFVLAGKGAGGQSGDILLEGHNILEGREVIRASMTPSEGGAGWSGSGFTNLGQAPGNDDSWGADPTHQRFDKRASGNEFMNEKMPRVTLSELPGWANEMMRTRGDIEANVSDAFLIYVTIVQLGWQRPSGGLWRVLDEPFVKSPMLIMNRPLIVKAVTFSQDNQTGTRATLELVNNAALSGNLATS